MANDSFFDDKSILIIDQAGDKGNDRTWCFWEDGAGEWDTIVHKTWPKVYFGSNSYSKTIVIGPYNYKMIRSEVYYKALWETIQKKSNFTFVQENVESFNEMKDGVQVLTEKSHYLGSKVFNSLPNPEIYLEQRKYPVLQQHFIGWFIETETETFDDAEATFMDFTVPQNGNTRFMYVLPLNKKVALFEYTLFSKDVLHETEYENAISNYLKTKGILNYKIVEKEKGIIPMTAFKFKDRNSEHILNIGTVGGWTKASTGYTFKMTAKKTKQLVEFLKSEDDLTKFSKISKFWFYDLLFLDVLARHNEEGAALFASMFKKTDIKTIFKFLDEQSTILEDLKIILAVPSKRFVQAFFGRLF